jgi:hypothetical protein
VYINFSPGRGCGPDRGFYGRSTLQSWPRLPKHDPDDLFRHQTRFRLIANPQVDVPEGSA